MQIFRKLTEKMPLLGIIILSLFALSVLITTMSPSLNISNIAKDKAGNLLYDRIKNNFIIVTPTVTPTPIIQKVTVTVPVPVTVYIPVPGGGGGGDGGGGDN